MVILDKNTFKDEVLETKGYVLVDYFGDGCVPCQALMPDVEELSKQYGNQVKFCKLNTTKARRLAISQRVLGLPTIVLYKDGEKIEEVVKDDANKENIEAMIKKHINI
ncbi:MULTISPECIES: thioredoxin TrxA [Clostridium]|uniref:Thioredoxin n=2 Tax=Clostridium TaxID=1485 RepID=D8GNH1_CLOLD|nr:MULTISPECIES: thioredoxin family protein [Clostridium]ADK15834.1 thioredoxin [Clostridium ljungdahlii DSM 13528]OAA84296.1 Thioredoxin [Clostridium ljungdahlii DSM 13528]OAA87966.1 Thioredoxin [Clostridium coskatii]OBR97601.1 thioredoxin [Clostridium coskatii]